MTIFLWVHKPKSPRPHRHPRGLSSSPFRLPTPSSLTPLPLELNPPNPFQFQTPPPVPPNMASINNTGPLGEHWFQWFQKPTQPISIPNLLSLSLSQNPTFSSISLSSKPNKENKPGKYKKMLEQYWWECENLPDYRHAPEVEKILKEDPVFEEKENPTQEEIEENKKWWEEFRSNPVVQFLTRAEEIADAINEMELKKNEEPFHKEDKKLWQSLPHVTGLDGRPMPRKAIKTEKEAEDKFWDFAKQFFFGLWGFRQRPYPPGRPIDAAQVIGYKKLEKRYYDCKYGKKWRIGKIGIAWGKNIV